MVAERSFARLVALVARRDYLRTVRRRGFLLGTLLLPAAIGLLIAISALASGVSLDPGAGPPTLVVVNESELELAGSVGGAVIRRVRLEDALAGLDDGRWREAYVVPEGYPERAQVRRIVTPTPGFDAATLTRRAQQQAALAELLRRSVALAEGVPRRTLERLVDPLDIAEVDPAGRPAERGPGPAAILFPTLFTVLFVMSIFITSNYLLQSVTEEKESRVVEIVLSSVPALPLMAGKICGLGAAGLSQVLIWLLTALAALTLLPALGIGGPGATPPAGGAGVMGAALGAGGIEPPGPLVLGAALLYFVLGYLAYGALFAAIGAIAPGTREAQQYSGFFGFVAVVPYILSGIFLTDPASPVVSLLVLFPLTAPAAALMVLMLAPEPPWLLVLGSLGLLAAFAVLATIGSARVFRATLLLYGTRPSLARVAGALLGRA